MSEQQVASRDTTFDHIKPESIWIDFRNTERDNYFTVILTINGKEKVIREFYIPGLDQQEGIVCEGHNLTWILKHEPVKQ